MKRSFSRGRVMKTSLDVLRLVCLIVMVAALAWPQSSYTAAARGTVTDSTGAAVPGAKVVLTETDRGVAHPATTDGAGRYVITALPPGATR